MDSSVKDARDLRDPQIIGEIILESLKDDSNVTSASDAYDKNLWHMERVEPYPQDESMCVLTQREYREELEARAAEGDKYAASALESLNAGKGVIGFDDGGD